MLYYANVENYKSKLTSEIEKIVLLEELPDKNWTYPLIQPKLIEEAEKRRKIKVNK